jgi:hypothetical protein
MRSQSIDSKGKHKAYIRSYRTFGTHAETLAIYRVYTTSTEIYYNNQSQCNPTIIYVTVSERTVSIIYR